MSTTTTVSIRHPHSFFAGGEWIAPSSGDALSVSSPVTEEVVMTFAEAKEADVLRIAESLPLARRAEGP